MAQKLELMKRKLSTVPVKDLRELAEILGFSKKGRHAEIVVRLISQDTAQIDAFIKRKYQERVAARQATLISDAGLIAQLEKVQSIEWGVVQGQLDRKIQSEYVRRYVMFDDLMKIVEDQGTSELKSYVAATWYNHWSTVLIEDQISRHPSCRR